MHLRDGHDACPVHGDGVGEVERFIGGNGFAPGGIEGQREEYQQEGDDDPPRDETINRTLNHGRHYINDGLSETSISERRLGEIGA